MSVDQARAFRYNWMMSVSARGFSPAMAGASAVPVKKWEWTSTDSRCPAEFLAAANKPGAPEPIYHIVTKEDPPGVWSLENDIRSGDWSYQPWVRWGHADDKRIEFDVLAYFRGSEHPEFDFTAIAARVEPAKV